MYIYAYFVEGILSSFLLLTFALFSLSVKRHCCFPVNWKTKKKKKERKKSDITPGI